MQQKFIVIIIVQRAFFQFQRYTAESHDRHVFSPPALNFTPKSSSSRSPGPLRTAGTRTAPASPCSGALSRVSLAPGGRAATSAGRNGRTWQRGGREVATISTKTCLNTRSAYISSFFSENNTFACQRKKTKWN